MAKEVKTQTNQPKTDSNKPSNPGDTLKKGKTSKNLKKYFKVEYL